MTGRNRKIARDAAGSCDIFRKENAPVGLFWQHESIESWILEHKHLIWKQERRCRRLVP